MLVDWMLPAGGIVPYLQNARLWAGFRSCSQASSEQRASKPVLSLKRTGIACLSATGSSTPAHLARWVPLSYRWFCSPGVFRSSEYDGFIESSGP